ncbi:MAG: hypothetical protein FWG06_02225 [Clostridiales bacterium]|nr:hypothetical protein [Clostridiales bacterium]
MNRKIWRLAGTLMLVLSLILLISGAAWAKDTAQLDYADIALRVPGENKNLDIMQRSLPILQKARDELSDIKDSTKGSSQALARLGQSYNNILMNPEISMDEKQLAGFMLQSMSMSQMSAGSISLDGINLQVEQLRIQIPQTEARLINSGQMLFITYHQLQDAINKMRSGRALLEESLRLAKTQQSAGVGTALAVSEAELALAELDTGIRQLESQCAQLLNQLKLTVGWPQVQIIKLGSIPKPNREFLGKTVLSEDTQSACDNSYTLKLKQAEHKYTDNDDQKRIITLTIEAQKEQIALALSTQYHKMADANNTLLLEEQRLVVAEQKVKQSRLQHQVGLMAEIALQAEENSYKTQQDAVKTAMDALFWEIENYKAIVAGLN